MIALLAFIFSLLTFWLTYNHGLRATILSYRPVLVFEYDDKDGWILRNIGNGPAMNVIVAQGLRESEEIRQLRAPRTQSEYEKWFNPIRIPPLAKDGHFKLSYLNKVNTTALGASYEDTDRKKYVSKCSNDLNEFSDEMELKFIGVVGKHWANPGCMYAPPHE
jgi:hypothetical protein